MIQFIVIYYIIKKAVTSSIIKADKIKNRPADFEEGEIGTGTKLGILALFLLIIICLST